MAAGELEGRLVPRGRVRESVRTVRTDRALRGARQQHSTATQRNSGSGSDRHVEQTRGRGRDGHGQEGSDGRLTKTCARWRIVVGAAEVRFLSGSASRFAARHRHLIGHRWALVSSDRFVDWN